MVQCSTMSGEATSSAFLSAPPLLMQSILDLRIKQPNWLGSIYELEEFPRGQGTEATQIVARGSMPPIERGMDKWKKLGNNTGCVDDCSPDCGYNITRLKGTAFERKKIELGRREFKSETFCIHEIQTTFDFKQVFALTVNNLHRQIDYFKEMNIGLNVLSMLAKKYVVDSNGPRPNPQNPHVYRPLGNARNGVLNMNLLEAFYERMRRMTGVVPYDVIDGSPLYALEASHQLLGRLYRDDPNLRQDVRFSSSVDAMLTKYNFMSTLRGMFIAAPILTPRRFNSVAGTLVEVLPYIDDIPAEVGVYTDVNPDYDAATYEEVLIHGMYPFKVMYLPTETTLGENTAFGPEAYFFNQWQWINIKTEQDPLQRFGYFMTEAAIGIAPQFSEGLFGILVERPDIRATAVFQPEPDCPPTPVDCDNSVPAVTCPCPLILSSSPSVFTSGNYIFTFASPLDVEAQDSIQIGLDTGGYLTGTVVQVSTDGKTVEVHFTSACPSCVHFVSVYCDDTLGCSSDVLSACGCTTGAGTPVVSVVLKNPIKAAATDHITVYLCDGTSGDAEIVSVDTCTSTYVLNLDNDDFTCGDVNTIVTVCVPPATDATCPACGGGPTVTYCS